MRRTRKLLVTTVAAAMSVTLLAGPALADKPITFTESITFPDDNPCTPEFNLNEHLVTINAEISLHVHENNIVAYSERSGTTNPSGFTMINGRDSFVVNGNVLHFNLMDQWRHSDGSKFLARFTLLIDLDTGEVQVEKGALRCLGNN